MERVERDGIFFYHFIPYPEVVYGISYKNTTSDFNILKSVERIIIVGGGLSAWSYMLAMYAVLNGIPLVFSELAYSSFNLPLEVKFLKSSFLGEASMNYFLDRARGDGFSVDQFGELVCLGNPILDREYSITSSFDRSSRVLLLSTPERENIDSRGILKSFGRWLDSQGYDVFVRAHPREGRDYWSGFRLDSSLDIVSTAKNFEFAAGYLGSAFLITSHLGCKNIVIKDGRDLPSYLKSAVSFEINSELDFELALSRASETPRDVSRFLNGEVLGSAERIVNFWIS